MTFLKGKAMKRLSNIHKPIPRKHHTILQEKYESKMKIKDEFFFYLDFFAIERSEINFFPSLNNHR